MAGYATFNSAGSPDPVVVTAAVKSSTGDPTAVLFFDGRMWHGKKATTWTPMQIAAAQVILETTPALTPRLAAQRTLDRIPIETRAIVLGLLDELNIIRAALPTPLAARTPAQALAAIRAKAGTL